MEAFVLIIFYDRMIRYGVTEAVIGCFFLAFFANICYCAGWGIEILIIYYFKGRGIKDELRITLLTLGILFSLLSTYVIVSSEIHGTF
jgi:succinate dehydrogenase hydrophobic anchor subunit